MLGVVGTHVPHDRLRHDITRGEIGQGVLTDHEALAAIVDEDRPLPPNRLGHQRLLAGGLRAEVHDRRVELYELHVRDNGTRTQSEADAVAGGHARVRGRREHLTDASRGQHHGRRQDRSHPIDLPLADDVQRDTLGATLLVLQQVQDQRVLDHPDPLTHFGDERPQDLSAGGVASGMGDPVGEVSALPGERDVTFGSLVEFRPPADQPTNRRRSRFHEHPDRNRVAQAGPGHDRVVHVRLWGVAGPEGGGDPALGPPCGALVHQGLGHDHHPLTRPACPQRGGESGDAGAHDDDVCVDGPTRRRRQHGIRQSHTDLTSTAQLSSSRVFPTRAATSNRPTPGSGGPRSAERTST